MLAKGSTEITQSFFVWSIHSMHHTEKAENSFRRWFFLDLYHTDATRTTDTSLRIKQFNFTLVLWCETEEEINLNLIVFWRNAENCLLRRNGGEEKNNISVQ